jgi:hypothetical protein
MATRQPTFVPLHPSTILVLIPHFVTPLAIISLAGPALTMRTSSTWVFDVSAVTLNVEGEFLQFAVVSGGSLSRACQGERRCGQIVVAIFETFGHRTWVGVLPPCARHGSIALSTRPFHRTPGSTSGNRSRLRNNAMIAFVLIGRFRGDVENKSSDGKSFPWRGKLQAPAKSGTVATGLSSHFEVTTPYSHRCQCRPLKWPSG